MSNESTNIIETMSAELEHLRPMEASLEMAEADIKAYKQRIAVLEKEIAELKEERRWRKCSEGLPLKGQRVLFLAKYKTDKVREWIGDFRHIDGMKVDFAVFYASAPGWGCEFLIDEVIGWMPLPSAPKEADK